MTNKGTAYAALVTLAAVVIFNAGAGELVEARPGSTLDAAAYAPFVVGNPPAGNCDPSYPTVCIPPPPPNLNCPDLLPPPLSSWIARATD